MVGKKGNSVKTVVFSTSVCTYLLEGLLKHRLKTRSGVGPDNRIPNKFPGGAASSWFEDCILRKTDLVMLRYDEG